MIGISLNQEEKTALKQLRLNQNSNVGERAHYVLLSSEGKTIPEIAAHLNRNKHTIRLWIKRYANEGDLWIKKSKTTWSSSKKGTYY